MFDTKLTSSIASHLLKMTIACSLLSQAWTLQAQDLPECPARPVVLALYELGHFYRAGVGLDKDVAEELARRSGCKFELPVLPRARIWQELQAGRIDMTLAVVKSAERAENFWLFPYFWAKLVVVLWKENTANIHSVSDFLKNPDLQLGILRGSQSGSYEEFVQQLRSQGRVVEANDTERLYVMLKARRFDAVFSVPMVYGSYLSELQMKDEVRIADWHPGGASGQAHLALAKRNFSEAQAQHWNRLLQDMIKDGTMLRLFSKYVSKREAEKMLAQ